MEIQTFKRNLKIAALLTGRGNNTLPDKNLLPVLGKPLLYYPAYAAKKSVFIDRFFVSSDDHNILNVSGDLGFENILRPEELSKPNSQHVDVIDHSIKYMEEKGYIPDILIVLLANNGFVNTSWIDECIQRIIQDSSISAVVPVYNDQEHHPYRAKKIDAEGFLVPFVDLSNLQVSTNRQDLIPSYQLSHNFWVLNVSISVMQNNGWAPWTFMGNKVLPFEIHESFDVHTLEDLERTERWLKLNFEF